MAAAHGISGISRRTANATATVVAATATITSEDTDRQFLQEVAQRGVIGRVEEHGRNEESEDEIRRQFQPRCAGNERQQRAADRDQRRIGDIKSLREDGKDSGPQKEHENCLEDLQLKLLRTIRSAVDLTFLAALGQKRLR